MVRNKHQSGCGLIIIFLVFCFSFFSLCASISDDNCDGVDAAQTNTAKNSSETQSASETVQCASERAHQSRGGAQTQTQSESESDYKSESDADADADADALLPLMILPADMNFSRIDKHELYNAILNVGFLKLEMTAEAKELAPKVDRTLKAFFKSLDFGQNIDNPDLFLTPKWWPNSNMFFGYSAHHNSKLPSQTQYFHVPKDAWIKSESESKSESVTDADPDPDSVRKKRQIARLNPFATVTHVMRFFEIMLETAAVLLERLWMKLDLFPKSDLYTILNGRKPLETQTQTESAFDLGLEVDYNADYNLDFKAATNWTSGFGISMYDPLSLDMNEDHKPVDIGLNEHFDSGIFTLLKTGGSGLQIKPNERSEWLNITNATDCNRYFYVNFGQLMNITTNGMFKAGLHRVLPIRDTDRLSIALFNDPNFDGWVYKYDENRELQPYIPYKQHTFDIIDYAFGEDSAWSHSETQKQSND